MWVLVTVSCTLVCCVSTTAMSTTADTTTTTDIQSSTTNDITSTDGMSSTDDVIGSSSTFIPIAISTSGSEATITFTQSEFGVIVAVSAITLLILGALCGCLCVNIPRQYHRRNHRHKKPFKRYRVYIDQRPYENKDGFIPTFTDRNTVFIPYDSEPIMIETSPASLAHTAFPAGPPYTPYWPDEPAHNKVRGLLDQHRASDTDWRTSVPHLTQDLPRVWI